MITLNELLWFDAQGCLFDLPNLTMNSDVDHINFKVSYIPKQSAIDGSCGAEQLPDYYPGAVL